MKSQDIFLLLKLLSLEKLEADIKQWAVGANDTHGWGLRTYWQDWSTEGQPYSDLGTTLDTDLHAAMPDEAYTASWFHNRYTVRGLADSTGISKSEVAASLNRCTEVGLVKLDWYTGHPTVNRTGLWEILVYGLRYIYPAKLGEMTRGIATGVGAPVFANKLMSGGEMLPVWPDPIGNTKGLAITPLFKTVPYAVKRDPRLYALLALTDSLRVGKPRERNFASKILDEWMNLK